MLDGDRRVVTVGGKLSGGARSSTQTFEDLEVSWARRQQVSVGPVDELVEKPKHFVVGRRARKDPAIGHDAHEAGEYRAMAHMG